VDAAGPRPLKLIVRFRMHHALAFGLTAMSLVVAPLQAQEAPVVLIHISAQGACAAATFTSACRDIGQDLRKHGVPKNADIHLIGDAGATYQDIKGAMESLTSAGFRVKRGELTGEDHAR
jgi:biopolymer transport protein ExbD